ncbi:ATP-dependent DNA helicase II subunit 2 [Cymbomonas tetramitiformis]|uniref:ATP-dependent DNA helicase II subunit 2 n=1 Tax=Cymbomonas tetramitiformis TaxID=36881 RepID=A0AAE0FAI8_9CHLO|nr:ATP-dependent DNA helicase II subunit 2 [Cymbomonas tetramitiformis]
MADKILEVFLVDVNPTMHPRLKDVSGLLKSRAHSKVVQDNKDEIALIVYGAEGTNNELNLENEESGNPEQYMNIDVQFPMQVPDLAKIRAISDLAMVKGQGNSDFLDALAVAIDMLVKVQRKGKKRILLVTDYQVPVDLDQTFMENLQAQLGDSIILEVLEVARGDVQDDAAEDNMRVLAGLAEGRVTPMKAALKLSEGLVALKEVKPVTTMRVDLEIGPWMSIKVWSYKKTSAKTFPSMKKYSNQLEADDPEATHLVTRATVYRSTTDADIDELGPEKLTRAYKFGKQKVPVDEAVEKMVSFVAGNKELKLVGFTKRSSIPRAWFLKDTNIIVPWPQAKDSKDKAGLDPEEAEKAALGLSSLAQALEEKECVAMVRSVRTANSKSVEWGMLTPHLVEEGDFVLFNRLPFAEDLHIHNFPSFDAEQQAKDKLQPSASQEAAARDLILALDIGAKSGHEDPFCVDRIHNPTLQRFYSFLGARALDADATVPPAADFLPACPLPSSVMEGAVAAFSEVTSPSPTELLLQLPSLCSSLFL